MGKIMNEQEVYSRNAGQNQRISYDASNRTQYVGVSFPNATILEAKWSIFKLTYDGTSGRVVTKIYANQTDDFSLVWNLKTTYDYTK